MQSEDKILAVFAATSAVLQGMGYTQYATIVLSVGALLKAVWPAPKASS